VCKLSILVTNPDTFAYLEHVIAELAKFKGCGPYIPKLVIGNKVDLIEESGVDHSVIHSLSEKASGWADLYGAIFMETW
jgi:GTPase SAR1 family protein